MNKINAYGIEYRTSAAALRNAHVLQLNYTDYVNPTRFFTKKTIRTRRLEVVFVFHLQTTQEKANEKGNRTPVSYTHLTLPTKA